MGVVRCDKLVGSEVLVSYNSQLSCIVAGAAFGQVSGDSVCVCDGWSVL